MALTPIRRERKRRTKILLPRKSKSEEELSSVENEIREKSIPYDYDTKEFPIEVLVQKFDNGELTIPNYQRELIWTSKEQSRFIESLFLGIPIPPVFGAISDDGLIEIIDGRQRIGAITSFVKNELELHDLEEMTKLNGFKFDELTIYRQRKFKLLTIRFLTVTDKADLATRTDIFDRLNSSGRRLLPAQVRKGAFATNKFYEFVMEMAESKEFTELYGVEKKTKEKTAKTNEDDELVLRYFAYSEQYEDFKHDVNIFLNQYVDRKGKDGFNRSEKETEFKAMLKFVKKYFPFGFKKTKNSTTIPRVRFEAISVGVHLAIKQEPDLIPSYMEWLDSPRFKKETTSDASNNQGKLKKRVEFVRDCLLGVEAV